MGRPRRSRGGAAPELDLLSSVGRPMLAQRLELGWWPDQARFPVNRATAKVRPVVWADLVGCSDPLVVTGFASIDQLVDVIGAWGQAGHEGRLRIGLGWEPFASATSGFGPPRGVFTDTVRALLAGPGGVLGGVRAAGAGRRAGPRRAGAGPVRHGDWRCTPRCTRARRRRRWGRATSAPAGLERADRGQRPLRAPPPTPVRYAETMPAGRTDLGRWTDRGTQASSPCCVACCGGGPGARPWPGRARTCCEGTGLRDLLGETAGTGVVALAAGRDRPGAVGAGDPAAGCWSRMRPGRARPGWAPG